MSWQNLGTFNLSKSWLIVPSVGDVFRVKHSLSSQYDGKYLKAVIAKAFSENGEINIYSPQRLSYRLLETELFYFPKDVVGEGIGFLRLDDTDVSWSINVQVYQENMFYSSINKTAATNAQPANDASVTTSKTLIVNEKSDGNRHSCLFTNTGPSTVYFKYVPIGVDYTTNTVTVSATSYDFSLAPGEKFLDDNSSQNAVVGICTGVVTTTAKVKVTEYIYS
ncbi:MULTISPECIES: hypothetical protein [unclassified Nostoc]|uniref:hypothetical protein n=1 Tax=unclassified Nostoc TaxID=2593658 RepID=UPI002AD285B8|nr:hypothetical protein [Nostoc sp. DedQUE03]MDZ7975753.1 hypothetical protein [Nostoc sp. DedQUE03]MDZ8048285.1 hypothetical protein [Nostoc sp. DedQUE02]